KQLLAAADSVDRALVMGWVKTRRDARGFSFIEVNDGSCLANLQVVAEETLDNYADILRLKTGSAIGVSGRLTPSPGQGQNWEMRAERVDIFSAVPNDYPLQKKRHSDEFLRTIAHLRPRTNKYGALFRIRSELTHAAHDFFRERGFHYIHTPILTASDCEGAGELFRVTTLDPAEVPRTEQGEVDYSRDFFGTRAGLTVSGQLEAETFALALGDVYTFGPTFRAENSNTSRHAAEFWMIEPEMAFCDLDGAMNTAEEMLKYLTAAARERCGPDLDLFMKYVDKTLGAALDNILDNEFERLSYKQAVTILEKSNQPFEYEIAFGQDLQSEHERYLTEQYFQKPVIVYDYPREIKPFYMRQNDDGRTVAAMDMLVPRLGEIIGGSQREERLDRLEARLREMDLSPDDYWWYLDSRRFGGAPHSGFGLGFERLLMFLTGVTNIRDVIPFPRTPRHIEF
ncbi:MAG: asparagine--tRNA ligase, partial [Desulfosudaceae bacterium]